jgi:hypothetical protein
MIAYRYRIIPGLPRMIAGGPAIFADTPGMIAGSPGMVAGRYGMTASGAALSRIPWLAAWLGCLVALPVCGDTLREVLLRNNVGLMPAGVDRSITSYVVENSDDLFAVAFYWLPEDPSRLPDTFQLRLFDRRSKKWTHAELPRVREAPKTGGPSWNVGSPRRSVRGRRG